MQYRSTLDALHALWDWCQTRERKIYAPMLVIWTATRPKLNKKHRETGEPCPYPAGVVRRACRYGQIGVNYERCTNNNMLRQELLPHGEDGEPIWFRAEELWHGKGEPVPDEPFLARHVDDHERLYLCFKPRQKPANGHLMIGYDKWYDMGTNREIEVPKAYLPPDKPLKPGKIPWRTIGLENVLEFECGDQYVIQSWSEAA